MEQFDRKKNAQKKFVALEIALDPKINLFRPNAECRGNIDQLFWADFAPSFGPC